MLKLNKYLCTVQQIEIIIVIIIIVFVSIRCEKDVVSRSPEWRPQMDWPQHNDIQFTVI